MVKAALQAGDESAACGRQDEPDLLGRIPAQPIAAFRIEAMDLLPLDVGEPQRLVTLDPDRPFAELGGGIPDQLRCIVHAAATCGLKSGAGEGIRTLDPNLGKVVLYP